VHKENLPEVLKKHILSINAPDGAVCYRSVSCDLAVVTKHRQSNWVLREKKTMWFPAGLFSFNDHTCAGAC